MSETKEESKPFRYVGTFENNRTDRPVAEMDKDALQIYISRLLSAKEQKSNTAEHAGK